MTRRSLVPTTKLGKFTLATVSLLIAIPLLTYLFLLGFQAYSTWQASAMLNELEALRIGSPEADFQHAVRHCVVRRFETATSYELTAGPYRFETPWRLLWKLPDDIAYSFKNGLERAGLRGWRFGTSANVHNGRILSISTGVFLDGRYESLGAAWHIRERVEGRYPGDPVADEHRVTYMHWNHITSLPPGEGFTIEVTPASDVKEWEARRINRGCLLSFRGCDGLCELLPDAARLLNERHSSFGGCTNVPRSWCELKDDDCRQGDLHSYK